MLGLLLNVRLHLVLNTYNVSFISKVWELEAMPHKHSLLFTASVLYLSL